MIAPRRGFTMIEVLVALTLLSVMMLAVATWTGIAATTGVELTRDLQWRTAANNLLQLIADDCVIGDFDTRGAGPGSAAGTVELDDSTLRIVTRSAADGPSERVYVYDPFTKRLTLRSQPLDARRSATTRPLLDHVLTWRCEIEEPTTPTQAEDTNSDNEQTSTTPQERVLVVTIVMASGLAADTPDTTVSRRYRLS